MDNEKKKKKQNIIKRLSQYMGNKKKYIYIAIVFSSIAAVLNVLPFYYVWKICKELFVTGSSISTENVMTYSMMVFIIAIAGIISYFFALILSHYVAFELEIGLKKLGFEKIINMPLGYFNTQSSGKIRNIINDGSAQTHSLIAHQLPDIASTIITPIVILGIFFYFDWRLGLAALFPIILSFIVMSFMMSKEGENFQDKYMNSLEEMSNESVEYVRAIPVVKTFGQSVKSFTRFYNSIQNYKDLVISYTKLWTKPYSIYLVLVESTACFLIPVSILIINNGGDIGVTISNFILYILVAPQLSLVMKKSMNFKEQKVAAEQALDRYENLFDYDNMIFPEEGCKFVNQDIEFKNVVFSYDDEKNILNNINFKVNKGETLALVGASGSGKTTIARLVARFWDVDSGEILIGGKNIKEYSKEVLMDNISFVFQNNQLFKTTLLKNIVFGRENITDDDIDNALIKSRAKEIIASLDDGLETVIGKKGTYLSGGEQQRIALARAFIKDAPIVLLDEATAFTDPENEHLIQAALKDLSKGKTTIMIAHRMTTVKNADNIAVIDNGKIVEYGNHDALMDMNGYYKKMWDEYQTAILWNIKEGA